jgi:squalene-hopene/tetraprenyl-beta-curcumene cyclase
VGQALTLDPTRLHAAYHIARDALLAERTADGYWVGELSSSALSTATAVTALAIVARSAGSNPDHDRRIDAGLRWLAEHQNPDGGWGDTVKSVSNVSTTMLCRAAFHACGKAINYETTLAACGCLLEERYGERPDGLARSVRRRYGNDHTFSVPILMMCALAGLVPWKEVARLPFEWACLPQSWYRFARMPVVSYALPALIAIGQVVHHFRPTRNPLRRALRWLTKRRSLRVLERIQPSNGGFLEATPLTSFVVMSLAAMQLRGGQSGSSADRVIARGVEFIVNSVRPDGSWPIDTNLSIWVTTLAVNALAAADDLELNHREELLAWLLTQQTADMHPYTGAAAGAWGWSHLPGSVPDCDDTPGALLALRALSGPDAPKLIDQYVRTTVRDVRLTQTRIQVPDATANLGFHVQNGLAWVRDLQNRDGGWPTFCRGWGKLPFDRSGCDLTAHALRAFAAWGTPSVATTVAGVLFDQGDFELRAVGRRLRFVSRSDVHTAMEYGFEYLARQQRPDGSWLPLWFGNQHAPDDVNPVYGTARVLAAYRDLQRVDSDQARRGIAFLLAAQNPDGGWDGARETPSSVEETAVAVEVLVDLAPPEARAVVERGLAYLVQRVEDGSFRDPSPIGFYFAKLWYFEKLYPIIFTVAALGRAVRWLSRES